MKARSGPVTGEAVRECTCFRMVDRVGMSEGWRERMWMRG